MTDKEDELEITSLTENTRATTRPLREQKSTDDVLQIKVYRRRWLMLLLFVLFSMGNKSQWIKYNIILNVISRYYGVSTLAVKSTALIYNVSFLVLFYPIMWMIHKWGSRWTLIIASTSTCVGTWIKYLSIARNGFAWVLVGQCFIGAWQIVILCMNVTLAAHWFGPGEVATATAIGGSGLMFGLAIFSIVPPIFVKMHEDPDDIGRDLQCLSLPVAIYCTCVVVLCLFLFESEPTLPPSKSRALQKLSRGDKFEFWSTFVRLVKNKNYLLLWNAQGLAVGTISTVNSSFNVFYLLHFTDGEEELGIIGLLFIVSGFVGTVVFGRILDKTKKFKTLMIILYVAIILNVVTFAISFYMESKWAIFVSTTFFGFFGYAYYSISFESCAELTYPEPESFCAALLNLSNQVYAAIIIICADQLILVYSDIGAYIFFLAIVSVGLVLTLLTENQRRRQTAGKNNALVENE